MISASMFYRLDVARQADLLLQQAVFLQSWREESFIVDLYELDDLLVELFYQYPGEELVSVVACPAQEKRSWPLKRNLNPRLTIKCSRDGGSRQDKSFAA